MCYREMVRTTLEIDDRVLEFARRYAQAEGLSLGKVISELARRGADSITVSGVGDGLVRHPDGLVTIDPRLGRPVTAEQVDAAVERFDLDDVGVDV